MNTIHIEHLEHWLRQQPADRTFNYCNNGKCLIGSFLNETYGGGWIVASAWFCQDLFQEIPMPAWTIQMLADIRNPCGFGTWPSGKGDYSPTIHACDALCWIENYMALTAPSERVERHAPLARLKEERP